MTYSIRCQRGDEAFIAEAQDAKQVVLPGLEDVEFFVHRGHLGKGERWEYWAVSERSTGMYLALGDTPAEAITNARKRIATAPAEIIRPSIQAMLEKYGPLVEPGNAESEVST